MKDLSFIQFWPMWAVAIYPVFDLVARWLGERRRLAAALITILLLVIVLGPVTWLGLDLVEVPRVIRARLESGTLSVPPPVETVKTWPVIGEPLFQFWDLASTNLSAALVKVAPHLKPLGGTLLGAAGSVGTAILQFFASVIMAGFLLSPGPTLVEAVATFLHRRVSRAVANSSSWLARQFESCRKASSAFRCCRRFLRVSG